MRNSKDNIACGTELGRESKIRADLVLVEMKFSRPYSRCRLAPSVLDREIAFYNVRTIFFGELGCQDSLLLLARRHLRLH
jgi:hypothetical protein